MSSLSCGIEIQNRSMVSDSILRYFEGKSILITGGSGLIGRKIVSRLIEAGASVRSVSLDEIQVEDQGGVCERRFVRF